MFEIRRYSVDDKRLWDEFVDAARNSTFLFRRDYMDYHADRFADFSLLFYSDGRLRALLPAHKSGTMLCSHNGLTYGGLIVNEETTAADVCDMFSLLNCYLRQEGFVKVVYKPVPWIYHTMPSDEDLYAIYYKCGARLSSRRISSAVALPQESRWRKGHRLQLQRAKREGVTVKSDAPLAEFWPLLEENLMIRHSAKPVHSLEEMSLLKEKFPCNICQYSAYKDGKLIGGVTLYISRRVIHCQYIATNPLGRKLGALETIFCDIIQNDNGHHAYLDFGTSNEAGGSILNLGLIANKEGYGARGVVYDTYEWEL